MTMQKTAFINLIVTHFYQLAIKHKCIHMKMLQVITSALHNGAGAIFYMRAPPQLHTGIQGLWQDAQWM